MQCCKQRRCSTEFEACDRGKYTDAHFDGPHNAFDNPLPVRSVLQCVELAEAESTPEAQHVAVGWRQRRHPLWDPAGAQSRLWWQPPGVRPSQTPPDATRTRRWQLSAQTTPQRKNSEHQQTGGSHV